MPTNPKPTITMYDASVPVFVQHLKALSVVLDKAEAYATARKIDPTVLLNHRIFPDMFHMIRQVQIATDHAKGATARLANMEVPSYKDEEKTFADLRARIAKTIAFIQSVKPDSINGSEAREIKIKVGGKEMSFKGMDYLLHFALPNFFFHTTAAYAIQRNSGVEIGKRDFIGQAPGMGA